MPHFKLLYENEYLGAHDLKGKDVTVTIDRVQMEGITSDEGTEQCPVVHFVEMQKRSAKERKRWILGKFNAKCVAIALGDTETDNWTGKKITLFPTECDGWGERMECVRVRVPGYDLGKSGNKLKKARRSG